MPKTLQKDQSPKTLAYLTKLNKELKKELKICRETFEKNTELSKIKNLYIRIALYTMLAYCIGLSVLVIYLTNLIY